MCSGSGAFLGANSINASLSYSGVRQVRASRNKSSGSPVLIPIFSTLYISHKRSLNMSTLFNVGSVSFIVHAEVNLDQQPVVQWDVFADQNAFAFVRLVPEAREPAVSFANIISDCWRADINIGSPLHHHQERSCSHPLSHYLDLYTGMVI